MGGFDENFFIIFKSPTLYHFTIVSLTVQIINFDIYLGNGFEITGTFMREYGWGIDSISAHTSFNAFQWCCPACIRKHIMKHHP